MITAPNIKNFTRAEAISALEKIQPRAYGVTRNYLDGKVTCLSPFISHGLLTIDEIVTFLDTHEEKVQAYKLYQELGWRLFFHNIWDWIGDKILEDIETPKIFYDALHNEIPPDIQNGTTGNGIIDAILHRLFSTGWLHNHERMWLAAYMCHWRKINWKIGAQFTYYYFIDGDRASNHLSWQWVASTFSSKPYFFNYENVLKYGKSLCKSTHKEKSDFDMPYPSLEKKLFPHGISSGVRKAVPLEKTISSTWVSQSEITKEYSWILTPHALGTHLYPSSPIAYLEPSGSGYQWSPMRASLIKSCLSYDWPQISLSLSSENISFLSSSLPRTLAMYGWYDSSFISMVTTLKKLGHSILLVRPPAEWSGSRPLWRFFHYWEKLAPVWGLTPQRIVP